ncbi:DUF4426 domain-containing protein [Marinobacter lutaoensis]|jgi:hypothetical protein|uniref:DUF4426 domain-containing protein n=1 Tax=Marinobacter lutaoensis TaxID=135739 RepID=A0A1V2DPI3_9GAMM|nr:DUF4426 domain-containing protein [Marinobacter lutaoensis]MBE03360.1 DUF4426 domain-containing protein [Marinobacter sp.]MBI43415.1 DUF4426 domain-containing protein [Oceanospirillales bacterium]ONF42306.1 hypothetical protein BTO32_16065 [Marinobacter lutaoensis]|tara:strand:- start:1473 stop:1931 length:459 start_codon:yes stop_codon:yes gene_type:complete
MIRRSLYPRVAAFAAPLLLLASLAAHAAGAEDFGDYQVHWSVLPSTFLAPEVAEANGLRRSNGIGIINIAIMREQADGTLKPVTGQVEGKVTNDIQQVNFLAFRRIQEGDAVYFIAEYQYRPGELMTFNITSRPSGHGQDLPIRFAHTLFSE